LIDSDKLTIEVKPLSNDDVDLTNNMVNITVNLSAPDFGLQNKDITFSDDAPLIDQEVTIFANITNRGDVAGQTEVIFQDGMPGEKIDQTNVSIGPQDTKVVNVTWVPKTTGPHSIYVHVASQEPPELPLNSSNDQAYKTITVVENMVPTIFIQDPVPDQQIEPGPYTFKGVALDADGDDLMVEISLDMGAYVAADWSSASDWYYDIDLTYASIGMHHLEARVNDGKGSASASVDFELIDIPVPGPFLFISARAPDSSPVIYENEHQDLTVEVVHSPDIVPQLVWYLDGAEVQNGSSVKYRYNTTYDDAGPHAVTVKAFGGGLEDWTGWNITVLNTNRAPVIIDHRPEALVVEVKLKDNNTRFNVTAIDADGDELSYMWYLNGTLVSSTGAAYGFKPSGAGTFALRVVVSDGNGGADVQEWEVKAKAEPPTKPVNTDVEGGLGWILLLIIIICIIVYASVRAYQERLKAKGMRARRRELRDEASDQDEFDDDDELDGDVEDYDEEYLD
jgi:hypothetical protein